MEKVLDVRITEIVSFESEEDVVSPIFMNHGD